MGWEREDSGCHPREGNPLVFVALGANLGDSQKTIIEAARESEKFSDEPLLRSSLWKTSPVDCPPGTPPFVNAVVGFYPVEVKLRKRYWRIAKHGESFWAKTQEDCE